MTPKEKAKELVDKFKKVELYHSMEPTDFDCEIKDISSASFIAKQCALIAVDEIINNDGFTQFDQYLTEYWEQVRAEINNL